jgi:hypothetical protein
MGGVVAPNATEMARFGRLFGREHWKELEWQPKSCPGWGPNTRAQYLIGRAQDRISGRPNRQYRSRRLFVRTPMELDGLPPLASRLMWEGVLVSRWIRS